MKRSSLVVLAVWLIGCGGGEAIIDEGDEVLDVAEGPLGVAGQDSADRGCNVVLRSLARATTSSGSPATKCVSGSCAFVFTGTLELSAQAVAEGGVPFVLYKNQDATTWSQVAAKASTVAATPGFKRYTFTLDRKTISTGLSGTGLSRARLDVAPFVKLGSGARLFDKQRGQGDFDNYRLTQAGGWQVSDDAAICPGAPVPATLSFVPGAVTQQGALIAGGQGRITYALERLTTCRGTHNGAPAWDVQAFVKFFPSGQLVQGSVKGVQTQGGNPSTSTVVPVPFSFTVPAGSTRAEVWFHNFTGAGSSCSDWDSNGGANFSFGIEAAPFAAPQWVGNSGSSTSRACSRSEGAPASLTLDSYLQQRACVWVESDVYVPGLTDGAALKPFALFAEAELVLDGVALPAEPLRFVERVGNDYRFHFELPKSTLFYVPQKWSRLTYTLRFSTDGRTWLRDVSRTVVRDASFCNPAWSDCSTAP